jgi:hypothetical protein
MTTKPNMASHEAENDKSQAAASAMAQSKRDIYPAVNSRLMGLMLWLGFAFVVGVILIQQFSGYN